MIPKSTGGDFWETVGDGARAAQKELGIEMRWEGTLTETEIAEQNRIVQNMINLGVDGIALAPLNAKASQRGVAAAADAGIPVVIFDSAVDGDHYVSFVATNNTAGGRLAGRQMDKRLGDAGGRVVVLRFVQGTGSTEARADGFIEAAKSGGLEIAADVYPTGGGIAEARKVSDSTLRRFVKDDKLEIEGIFAANLYTTLGMLAALDSLRQSGIEVHAKFIGFDSNPRLVAAVQDGRIDGLIVQNPYLMGELTVQTLVKHLHGEKVEKFVDTGVEYVNDQRLKDEPAVRKLVGLE